MYDSDRIQIVNLYTISLKNYWHIFVSYMMSFMISHHRCYHNLSSLHMPWSRWSSPGWCKRRRSWRWPTNFGQELQTTPKRDLEWTVGELNAFLENNLVPSHGGKGQLLTLCCIQREWELYSGRPKARCYPFYLRSHRFRGKNCQVIHMIWYHM